LAEGAANSSSLLRSPALPYVAPFAAFLAFLAFRQAVPLSDLTEQLVCFGVIIPLLVFVSRPVIDLRVSNFLGTAAVGVAVFVLWIGPDRLIPGYRDFWLFSNPVTGRVQAGVSAAARDDWAVLALRALRASIIVPILEELFWRAWLMRWLIQPDFEKVKLGNYSAKAFWIVALLFASEHGPYWEVGLVAGVIYNWWMVRTRSLGDLILAHGITNACLSAYVVFAGHWEYWA